MARGRGRGRGGGRGLGRGAANTNGDVPNARFEFRTGIAIADDIDDILQSRTDRGSTDSEPRLGPTPGIPRARPRTQRRDDDEVSRSYYGPQITLMQPTGPPLEVEESIGGMIADDPSRDPRISAILPDVASFTISVHPLHLPNSRAMFSSASSTSVIDWRFVRLAGLLPKMVPIRDGVDRVDLRSLYGGGPMRVYGRVDVLFDAHGYEFEQPFWVTDIGFPVEMVLGVDWAVNSGLTTRLFPFSISKADARKTRTVEDVYRMI
ncbi:hypothetical protein NEOLEDRAFT_1129672 [Neolentinus lepideus HHB14362 ss-1]|uniref:Uncharacterized protein n=1 Tax=Neolentinus lepideus HHB14362 ss-1 TaxID=1314782 RepID=A0A165UK58_9AGAM|nr:hypothetical protein NEOLEDRAFT_1129672 [Neolentinus lepideus HHB14362 ss-1]